MLLQLCQIVQSGRFGNSSYKRVHGICSIRYVHQAPVAVQHYNSVYILAAVAINVSKAAAELPFRSIYHYCDRSGKQIL
jgi:hypothetical protein